MKRESDLGVGKSSLERGCMLVEVISNEGTSFSSGEKAEAVELMMRTTDGRDQKILVVKGPRREDSKGEADVDEDQTGCLGESSEDEVEHYSLVLTIPHVTNLRPRLVSTSSASRQQLILPHIASHHIHASSLHRTHARSTHAQRDL